jgi:hypothetical protein
MKLTCPRCSAKGIAVGWLDCLSHASHAVPRRCAACGGEAKRRWFSLHSFVAALPMQLSVVLLLLYVSGFPVSAFLVFAGICVGAVFSILLQGFWEPFAPWPKPIIVPPVVIPPEEDAA